MPYTETKLRLIPVTASRIGELRSISIQTFVETFGAYNTEENMSHYLANDLSEETLGAQVKELRSRFFLAEGNGRIIGYLKVNFAGAQSDLQDPTSLEVERIYVLKAYHGTGVGALLLKYALDLALEAAHQFVWLAVWEHNARAISFYRKKGFLEFGTHHFQLGEDRQKDLLMRLELAQVPSEGQK